MDRHVATPAAAQAEVMAELKIIGAAAFRTFRNLWMLEELGVVYTHVNAMPRSPEANAVNPFGKIPALIDQTADGQTFTIYGALQAIVSARGVHLDYGQLAIVDCCSQKVLPSTPILATSSATARASPI